MKATTPEEINALAIELQRQSESKVDFVTPSWGIQATQSGTFRLWQGSDASLDDVVATKTAHSHIAEKCGIPPTYYQRTLEAPELWAQNVNHWMSSGTKNVLVRMLDGKLRAVLSDRYRVLDNVDLFYESAKIARQQGAQITRADLSDDGGSFYARFIHPEWQERISTQRELGRVDRYGDDSDGELVIPGVIVSNSETGRGGLRAAPFIHFLACSNGMVADGALFQIHLGKQQGEGAYMSDETRKLEDFTVWSKIRDLISATFDRERFRKMIADVRDTTSKQLEHPLEAVDNVVKHFGMSDDDRKAIFDELVSPSVGFDRGRTVYGLANAITARAHAYSDEPDRMLDFERAGAELVFGKRELVAVR